MTNKRKSFSRLPSFIKTLLDILQNPDNSQILHWSDDGESIVLEDSVEVVNYILPNYFKHSNLSSFIRQLNMYDFHKSLQTSNVSIYSHPFFQRGKENLYRKIKRKAKKEEEESDSIMIQKQSVLQIKEKMSKLYEKEEQLQIQNENLLKQRDELMKIRQFQEKEYETLPENLRNRSNKNSEQSHSQNIPLLQNECKQEVSKGKIEESDNENKKNQEQNELSYSDRLSFKNYVRAKLKTSRLIQ